MSTHESTYSPGTASLLQGILLSISIIASTYIGNLYLAFALAFVGCVVAFIVAKRISTPINALYQGFQKINSDKRTFLLDEVESWNTFGPLGQKAAEAMEFSMLRREYYRSAVLAVGTPFFITNKDGIITHCSQSMAVMLRKPQPDLIGKTVSQAFYNKSGVSITEDALHRGSSIHDERSLTLWDGRSLACYITVDCFHGLRGDLLGAVTTITDQSQIHNKQLELEKTQSELRNLGDEINELSQRVASASEELSASSDEQARGAQQQKDQADSVATAMEQMTATVMEVAQNASQTSGAASSANEAAESGAVEVREAVVGIKAVAESAGKLGQVLTALDGQAAEIGRIISVINDIADQTNLLALNAAIEAARAGDAGRGFAVVADEVRKLAEKTMTATKEVEKSIREIQDGSRHAVASMQETESRVSASTEATHKAGEALERIKARINEVNGQVTQIAAAAEEQSAAAEEISHNIEVIARVAAEADEGAGQTAQATRELAELANSLLTLAGAFAQRQGNALNLRQSQGNMKGILPKLMQDFIREQFGQKVFDAMQEAMGHPTFLPTQNYPDQVLRQMADFASEKSGKSTKDIFLALGRFTIKGFHRHYPRYFKADTLKDFFLTMNDTHARLTKDMPGLMPPRFTYEDMGDRLVMTYHSKRAYPEYYEGILRGAAEFFKEPVDISVSYNDPHTARAEVVFRGGRRPKALGA
ncbi:PAS domain-containing protein [Desulfovibrio aerotolerans]|uniref:PAS domain-containing protein n=2 Tax=Solidesulfovibrio aerotolerans TaxID=295255 RepID=A0A7C9ITL8_9BACT|nr:methyl-accepting chemotaxis protein [Solidesulfovibrio aerotolerans]MYL82580.1 PAS domain-containing protein [Solidesulfovibrio aerotolerans]